MMRINIKHLLILAIHSIVLLIVLIASFVIKDRNNNEEVIDVNAIEQTKLHNGDNKDTLNKDKDFYHKKLSSNLIDKITGKSYKDDYTVPYDDLRYVHVLHYDVDGNIHEGELIVNKAVAKDTVEIFKELFEHKYPIEKIRLIDEYDADDDKSMEDNNSSAFNYRKIDGTNVLSKHSLGLAIDINPLYNPYVRNNFGGRNVLPVSAVPYVNRESDYNYKVQKGDACYNAFIKRGWTWGGEWTNQLDYQHFEFQP